MVDSLMPCADSWMDLSKLSAMADKYIFSDVSEAPLFLGSGISWLLACVREEGERLRPIPFPGWSADTSPPELYRWPLIVECMSLLLERAPFVFFIGLFEPLWDQKNVSRELCTSLQSETFVAMRVTPESRLGLVPTLAGTDLSYAKIIAAEEPVLTESPVLWPFTVDGTVALHPSLNGLVDDHDRLAVSRPFSFVAVLRALPTDTGFTLAWASSGKLRFEDFVRSPHWSHCWQEVSASRIILS